jgi:hypothetical protein
MAALFNVRASIDFSIQIEADSEEDAISKAPELPTLTHAQCEGWDEASDSDFEAEEAVL